MRPSSEDKHEVRNPKSHIAEEALGFKEAPRERCSGNLSTDVQPAGAAAACRSRSVGLSCVLSAGPRSWTAGRLRKGRGVKRENRRFGRPPAGGRPSGLGCPRAVRHARGLRLQLGRGDPHAFPGAAILITNKAPIQASLIEASPELKFITLTATGFDCVDITAARRRGIPVSNVPVYGTRSVAQFVFALLLELCHHVNLHDQAVRGGVDEPA